MLPNIWVKFDSWLKNAAGPPVSLAWTINASIMREKLVATCWEAGEDELKHWQDAEKGCVMAHHRGDNEHQQGNP